MLKGFLSGDIVDEECTSCSSVVAASNAAKGFLACCVPDLEFELFVFYSNDTGAKLDSNGQVMYWSKSAICELPKERQREERLKVRMHRYEGWHGKLM